MQTRTLEIGFDLGYAASAARQISGILDLLPPSFADLEFPRLDLLCQFDTTNHHGRCSETLQSQRRSESVLHAPMILFDQIVVQILAAPHYHSFGSSQTHSVAFAPESSGVIGMDFYPTRMPARELRNRTHEGVAPPKS